MIFIILNMLHETSVVDIYPKIQNPSCTLASFDVILVSIVRTSLIWLHATWLAAITDSSLRNPSWEDQLERIWCVAIKLVVRNCI